MRLPAEIVALSALLLLPSVLASRYKNGQKVSGRDHEEYIILSWLEVLATFIAPGCSLWGTFASRGIYLMLITYLHKGWSLQYVPYLEL